MTTPALPYAPVRDGYTFAPGCGIVSTKLEGGASRMRLDVIGSSHTVEMQWILRGLEYTILMGFFRDTLAEGSLPFLMDLLADVRVLTTHKCRCMNGVMPRLTANKGDAYFVQGSIEVERNPTYTGSMTFSVNTAGFFPPIVNTTPHLLPEYLAGDLFRIIDAVPPAQPSINFDGVYTVTTPAPASLLAAAGAIVNPNWNLIDPGSRTAVATITKVPI